MSNKAKLPLTGMCQQVVTVCFGQFYYTKNKPNTQYYRLNSNCFLQTAPIVIFLFYALSH